jgi:ribonuclease E
VHEQPALQAQQAPIVQVQEVLVKEVLVHEEVTPAAVAQEPKQESLLQSIIAPAQEPATIAVAAPVADPSPIVVPSSLAPTVDKATLHALVQQAGLQWIESDPTRVSQVQQSITAQPVKRLGREPKPVAVVSNAALVQVETRR